MSNALELHSALLAEDKGLNTGVDVALIEHAMDHELSSMPNGLAKGFQMDRGYRRAFHAMKAIRKIGNR